MSFFTHSNILSRMRRKSKITDNVLKILNSSEDGNGMCLSNESFVTDEKD